MKKLGDLKVATLRQELEKRDLDKTGVKSVLQERLHEALKEEGHDPEVYCFDSESNEVSLNEGQDDEPEEEDAEANEKEEDQVVTVNEEEMGEFDNEKPKEKKKSPSKGQGASRSKSPPRPDSVPVVVPFTSKDTIELASSLKPSSDDASLIVNIDDQSVRDESLSQNGNVEDGKKEEKTGEGSTAKKTEDSTAKSSQSESATETKEKEKKKSSPNLWVSGLASTTRATDLKQIFSKYGKVTGAKVVTNAKTPGSRCYGFVTMASPEEASRCIQHLHRTELHGRMISVERAKTESALPQKKKEEKNETDKSVVKKESVSNEKGKEHRRTIDSRYASHKPGESNRDRPPQRGHKDVLSFDKIKEERERQKIREQERQAREESRRQREERERQWERERRHREEKHRIDREKRELRMERERLEKEKMELLKMQKEQTRIERRRIEREKEQLLREQRKLSDPKRKRSPDYGYDDDRKRSRFPGSRDSLRSREQDDIKMKIQRERERLLRQRSSDDRRVVERSRLDRYKDDVPSRWPPNGGPSHIVPKAPALQDAKWGASASWGGRLGASASALGGGGWGPAMGGPPQNQIIMSHHGMGMTYGSTPPSAYPVMRRY